jgi:hypothetical protein
VICARRKASGQLPQAGHRGSPDPGASDPGWLKAASPAHGSACERLARLTAGPVRGQHRRRWRGAGGRLRPASGHPGPASPGPVPPAPMRTPGTRRRAGRRGACAWSPSPRASGPRSEADRWSRHTSRPRRTTTSCTSRPSPPGRTTRATSTSNHHHRLYRPAGKHRGEGWVHGFKARPRRGA